MSKRIILITGILALIIGVSSYVLAEQKTADPNIPKKQQKAKLQRPKAGDIAKRFDNWMDELNKAYEAKDMHKIGKLIENMNKARKQMKQRMQQMHEKGEKWQGEREKFGKGGKGKEGKQGWSRGWHRHRHHWGMHQGYHQMPMGPRMGWGRGGYGWREGYRHSPQMSYGYHQGPRMAPMHRREGGYYGGFGFERPQGEFRPRRQFRPQWNDEWEDDYGFRWD